MALLSTRKCVQRCFSTGPSRTHISVCRFPVKTTFTTTAARCPQHRPYPLRFLTSSSSASSSSSTKNSQQAAFDYYRRQQEESSLFYKLFGKRLQKSQRLQRQKRKPTLSRDEANVQIAWYVVAMAVGAVGATYAAVPLYKVFCQTTGFGGTTQRLRISYGDEDTKSNKNESSVSSRLQAALDLVWNSTEGVSSSSSSSSARTHTWTDQDAARRLATLRPVENADLLTIRFDTTVGSDALPWSFRPVQLDVKVVPGETALSFFRVTNHSKTKAITGVATYNVHPPKVGLYFTKIQCFCFEEQRLLPGETVDMPVFFFIDPDFLKDPQVSYVKSITLSYTFFPTDEDEEDDSEE